MRLAVAEFEALVAEHLEETESRQAAAAKKHFKILDPSRKYETQALVFPKD